MTAEKHNELLDQLNRALGLEMRAEVLYAHYAAYVRGIHRLHLKPYFEAEASESFAHANSVRNAINQLGGEAVTVRDEAPIRHTTDYRIMLDEVLATEKLAAETYSGILELVMDNDELHDLVEQIYFTELRSVEELTQLMQS
jgi:bacterioferritin